MASETSSPVPSGDGQLLDQWAAGDARSGNELFERHFEAVYRFFAHKAPDASADLVQRTFLACLESRARFRRASSFRTFLFSIARHELLGHWKRSAPDADPLSSSVRDHAPSPSATVLERVEHRLLLEALRGLALDLQLVLELHYWEQLGMAELAEVLEIPEGTAKSRLRRAREALRESLAALERNPERLASTLDNLDAWATSLKQALFERG